MAAFMRRRSKAAPWGTADRHTPDDPQVQDLLTPRVTGSGPMHVGVHISAGDVITTATGTRNGQPVSGEIARGSTTMGPTTTPTRLGVPSVDLGDPSHPVTWD